MTNWISLPLALCALTLPTLFACGDDGDPAAGGNQPGSVPISDPSPPPSASPTGALQPDWSSVSLQATSCPANVAMIPPCVESQILRIDDSGGYSSSQPPRSGRISEADLLRLDSRIDAIKEEALQPFTCAQAQEFAPSPGWTVFLTFENRPNAIIYRSRPEIGEICWSGDRESIETLVSELKQLRQAYGCACSGDVCAECATPAPSTSPAP